MKTGRNEPCPCGSGKKYKQCCLNKQYQSHWPQKLLLAVFLVVIGGAAVATIMALRAPDTERPGQVWSEEHQHWHPAP